MLIEETGRGTTPEGIENEQRASTWVRGMFDRIAPRYDLLNHLLSFNIDRYWRARTVARVAPVLAKPGARILDLCCGTGDLTLALQARSGALAYGSDFCHPMLVEARRKTERRHASCALFEADALRLPLSDASFDLLTMAFGFRNLANYQQGLRELLRVLKPGGTLAILEFSTPPNAAMRRLYGIYSKAILPRVGGWISGSKEAYAYLPESVRKFPGAIQLAGEMRGVGFQNVRFERMTAGVVALHLGERLLT